MFRIAVALGWWVVELVVGFVSLYVLCEVGEFASRAGSAKRLVAGWRGVLLSLR